MDTLLSFFRNSCMSHRHRQVGPIRVAKANYQLSSNSNMEQYDDKSLESSYLSAVSTTKPVVSKIRTRRYSHASAKEITTFLQSIDAVVETPDEMSLPANPIRVVALLHSKGDLASFRVSKSALLILFAKSLGGETVAKADKNEDADDSLGMLTKAVTEYCTTCPKLSLAYQLVAINLLASYMIDILDAPSEALSVTVTAPVILELCSNLRSLDMHMQSEEAKNITRLLWVQACLYFMRLWFPVFFVGRGDIRPRPQSKDLKVMLSVLATLAPCVHIASSICNEKEGLVLIFWAYCKRFFENLQTLIHKISNAHEVQEQDIVRSYVHLLHSIAPAPTELLVELTRRRSLIDSDNTFAGKYQQFVVVSSLLTMVETNIKLPRQEQWISSICDMLLAGTDFSYAAENITTRHIQLTPLVTKLLLHLLVRDQSRSQNVASNVFKILAKRLIIFSKALNILPTSNCYNPITTKSSSGNSPVFSPLGSAVSFQINLKGDDNTSMASSSEAIGPFFQIGDKVDGLVQLENGSRRWFPGSISAVNASVDLYTIAYNDGDIDENKPSSEIRVSKTRHPPTMVRSSSIGSGTRSSSANSSSSSINGATHFIGGYESKFSVGASSVERVPNRVPYPIDEELDALGVVTTQSEDMDGSVADSEDSGEHFFEIPSVFGDSDVAHRRDNSVGIVPLMQLNDLMYSGPLDASGNSLSSSLLRQSNNLDENLLVPTSHSAMSARSMWSLSARHMTGRSHILASTRETESITTKLSSWRADDGTQISTTREFKITKNLQPTDEPKSLLQLLSETENLTDNLARTFSLVVAILLNQSVDSSSELINEEFYVSSSTSSSAEIVDDNIENNVLFSIREFLDSTQVGQFFFKHYCILGGSWSKGHTRLLKLLSKLSFSCCMSSHWQNNSRISHGAFGSVYKIVCPTSCPMCWSSVDVQYAIKRIAREGSSHDIPTILSVYNEISCLESLKMCPGVCKIYDFGIENMDYCIVMECGTLNLAEWRSKTFGKFLMNSEEIILLLLIYYDILLIIETIHAADIVHFDIKCCNFVLRNEALSVEHMKHLLRKNEPSGKIFLCDFGESLPNMELLQAKKTKSPLMRARGTLFIQSPEMLSLSESSFKLKGAADQRNLSSISAASDIWSLGCLLAELVTGNYLFAERTWPDLYVSLFLSSEIILPLSDLKEAMRDLDYRMPRFVEKLITSILKHGTNERMSIQSQKASLSRFLDEVCLVNSPSRKHSKAELFEREDRSGNVLHRFQSLASPDNRASREITEEQALLAIPRCNLLVTNNVLLSCGFDSSLQYPVPTSKFIVDKGLYEGFRVLSTKVVEEISEMKRKAQIASFSVDYQKSIFEESLTSSCSSTEIRIVDSLQFPNVLSDNSLCSGSGQREYLDVGNADMSMEFFESWLSRRSLCQETMRQGGRVFISIGKEIPINFSNTVETTASLLESMDRDSSYCECSCRILTCGLLFAWSLLYADLSDVVSRGHQSPLFTLDRLLPGISQVCSQTIAKEWTAKLLVALENRQQKEEIIA